MHEKKDGNKEYNILLYDSHLLLYKKAHLIQRISIATLFLSSIVHLIFDSRIFDSRNKFPIFVLASGLLL